MREVKLESWNDREYIKFTYKLKPTEKAQKFLIKKMNKFSVI